MREERNKLVGPLRRFKDGDCVRIERSGAYDRIPHEQFRAAAAGEIDADIPVANRWYECEGGGVLDVVHLPLAAGGSGRAAHINPIELAGQFARGENGERFIVFRLETRGEIQPSGSSENGVFSNDEEATPRWGDCQLKCAGFRLFKVCEVERAVAADTHRSAISRCTPANDPPLSKAPRRRSQEDEERKNPYGKCSDPAQPPTIRCHVPLLED